jgi:DNA-binding CsgD family transcriptional regulator
LARKRLHGKGGPDLNGKKHAAHRQAPLVGRLWELLVYDQALAALHDGQGRALLLTGVPGIGKTRLAEEFADRARARGYVTVAVDGTDDVAGLSSRVLPHTGASVVVVLDGPTPDQLSMVDDLRSGLAGVPLLLVAAVTRSDEAAGQRLWPGGVAGQNTIHLELGPLPAESVLELVAAALPGVGRDQLAAIAAASGGNPGIAHELCRWTLDPYDDVRPSTTPYLAAALAGGGDILATLVLSGEPSTACLVSEASGIDRPRVVEELEACRAAGFVERDNEFNPRYRLAHPLLMIVARALASPQRRAELNHNLARAIGREEAGAPSAASVRVAEHLLAVGVRGTDLVRACLAAAGWLAGAGDHVQAVDLATRGLADEPDPVQEVELLLIAGRSAMRSGAYAIGKSYLQRALAGARALADGELFADAVVNVLEAAPPTGFIDRDRQELLAQALRSCPADALGLQARLQAHRAREMYFEDLPGYRATAGQALALARRSGDPEALGLALAERAGNPIPHEVEEYASAGAEVSQLPGAAALGAIPAVAYSAMAMGRRETLEAAAERFTALQDATGDRLARSRLALLAAGRAILDAKETELIDALRLVTAEAAPVAAVALPAAAAIWRAHTGQPLPQTVQPPELPPGLPAHILGLPRAAEYVILAEYGDPVMRAQMTNVVLRMPDPTRLPLDSTWSTWQAVNARAATLIGDAGRCRRAVDHLGPFADQFVVLGQSLPVGPVGWFLADPLWLLGRTDEALDANARAERISRALASRGWVAHCLIQRGRLLRRRDPAAACAGLIEAQQIIAETGMVALGKQVRKLLDWIGAHTAVPPGHTPPAAPAVDEVSPDTREPLAGLAHDDMTILRHAAAGMTNVQIAETMRLSVATIERRFTNMYRRLGVRNRAHAVNLLTEAPGR